MNSFHSNLIRSFGILAMLVSPVAVLAEPEKDLTVKTGHRYVSNVAESAIDDIVAKDYRMFDIEVLSTGPHRYAATFVKNDGPYAESWWWTANKTEAQLNGFYDARNARIIDLEAYTVNGVRRYAATMVQNSGTQAKAWWWFDGKSWPEMLDLTKKRNARLIDIDVEVRNGKRYYSGVMIHNSGTDFRPWRVLSLVTTQQIKDAMSTYQMRLVDLERISADKFAAIIEEGAGQAWWWFVDKNFAETTRLIGQFGSRVIDIERRIVSGKSRFDIVLLDNNNDLEWRIGQMLRNGSNGTRGFILKEVGGPLLGTILPDFPTYPASTIKVLEHYYWSWRVGLGLSPLTSMPIYSNHTSDTHVASDVATNQTLTLTAQQMMRPSNNQSTNALQEFAGNGDGSVGRDNINSFKETTLGLNDRLYLYHKFASGNISNDPFNTMTMTRIAGLYEDFADSVGLNLTGWSFFRNNMLNESGVGGSNFGTAVLSVMQQEGATLGMTNAEITAMFNQVLLCWKAGNVPNYQSAAGWIRLPYKTRSGVITREFVLGVFQDNFTTSTLPSLSGGMFSEILRDQIREALDTWK